MPPTTLGAVRTASTRLLTLTGAVYTADVATGKTGGKYTVLWLRSLACRLLHPAQMAPSSAAARAELLADRDLWFDPDVLLPEQCRVVISGVSWQPRAGTFEALGDGITVVARRCIVVRVQTTSF
ncbi:MAG: hypothetical protein NVSMB2_25490 [Chloroflexota bacterium]